MDMGVDGAIEIGDIIVTYQRLVAIATMIILVISLYPDPLPPAHWQRCAPSRRTAPVQKRSASMTAW
jgi:hypothetical protein